MTDHPPRVRRWPYVLFRGTTASLAALGLAQAAIAGGFLSGHYDALMVHLVTAMVMVAVAVVQAVTAVFLRRAGGPRSVMLAGLLLPLPLAAQGGLGMERVLGLHVPLGVLVVVAILRLAAWAWRAPLPTRVRAADMVRENRPVGALS